MAAFGGIRLCRIELDLVAIECATSTLYRLAFLSPLFGFPIQIAIGILLISCPTKSYTR